jgi:hypothetical protein
VLQPLPESRSAVECRGSEGLPQEHTQYISYTVHSKSFQTPWLFLHFLTLQPYSKTDYCFFSSIDTQYPIMTSQYPIMTSQYPIITKQKY